MKDSRLRKIIIFITTSFLVSALISCASTKTLEVAEGATEREIIQMAQSAWDSGKKDDAEFYYKTLVQRYGMNTATYVEGRYELAHLYIKEKRYEEAYPLLTEILDIYKNTEPGYLPGTFRKMSENDLAKIPEETVKKIEAEIAAKKEAEKKAESELTLQSEENLAE